MKFEWKLLQENLPKEGIYIRTYESRIDLLKVVIVGPGIILFEEMKVQRKHLTCMEYLCLTYWFPLVLLSLSVLNSW